ncbi:MAG TPA: efflux RND transporter periplasmic adaptor subunit [Spirochaetia bacterium]|nr:efflux RND transporter periplasmic adaptor subunit [Spirochaetales bacterium]HRS64591.1 efflux RND transporter periplasmic adaptor subunit [Spirochaetia bacterium]HOT59578.1 efflux RND transporter periplasmic adaptor subunit [Spirochaetales bacterium]HPD80328.1 efflux RND transporter periplasmic adaptor subunit [Spirochaetales bacterium]HQG40557.1 efflux RND transporter periplasmic adaptor subunit [Spirochaetales bacterium]
MTINKKLSTLIKIISLVVLLAVSLSVSFIARAGREKTYEAIPIPVKTMKPIAGDFSHTISFNGHIESNTMVTVLPLVSGILKELPVEPGQQVRKNEVIARIDAERYELQLQQAKAAWLNAKSTYERVAQLYAAQATSLQNYEQAKAQYDAYSSQYDLAKLQLEYTAVKSPIDGVVLAKHLTAGSLAAPERPLVTIGDINNLIVKVKIPEKYYEIFTGKNKITQILIIRNDNEQYKGIIQSVSPFISADTKNFEVTVAIQDDQKILRPGMFVKIEIELARIPKVLMLPVSALAGSNRVWYVQDGKAYTEQVELTYFSDDYFVIPEEWRERECVIEGSAFLREGSPVVVP